MKIKTCKGNYNVDKFEGCGGTSFKFTYGLCPSCLYEWMTTTENGKIHYAKSFQPKVKKTTVKRVKEANKEVRESMKSIARLIKRLEYLFRSG